MELPPEDQPDQVKIGPLIIPIIEDDDPRFEHERSLWSAATKVSQALHTWTELEQGLTHEAWRVRHESVIRMAARWPNDPRTLPALLRMVSDDPAAEVRDAAVMRLTDFPGDAVRSTLHRAAQDPSPDVRWSANYCLDQHGFDHEPYWENE